MCCQGSRALAATSGSLLQRCKRMWLKILDSKYAHTHQHQHPYHTGTSQHDMTETGQGALCWHRVYEKASVATLWLTQRCVSTALRRPYDERQTRFLCIVCKVWIRWWKADPCRVGVTAAVRAREKSWHGTFRIYHKGQKYSKGWHHNQIKYRDYVATRTGTWSPNVLGCSSTQVQVCIWPLYNHKLHLCSARLILSVCVNLRGMLGKYGCIYTTLEFGCPFAPVLGQRSEMKLKAVSSSGANENAHRAWVGSACNGFTQVLYQTLY